MSAHLRIAKKAEQKISDWVQNKQNIEKMESLHMAGIYQFGYFELILAFFLNFEGWFRGLFQMYDLNGVYHEKADVRGIPKMW